MDAGTPVSRARHATVLGSGPLGCHHVAMSLARSHSRDLDLVLFGATGFTGGLTAAHLARNAPADLRWEVAGRDPARLDRLVESLADEQCPPSGWSVVEVEHGGRLAQLARRTAVIVTTVGPYLEHGEPVVRACADAGTHYLDLTGEAEFVDRMYDQHHERAQATGAKLVHACGFDSIPHDLGAQYTVEQLAATGPLGPVRMRGVVRASGTISGGTLHSALGAISRADEARRAADRRRRREPRPVGRRARAVSTKVHRDEVLGLWLVPLPTLDPAVVVRSARALEEYGPDFTYSHHAGIKKTTTLAKGALALTGLMAAAKVPPLRAVIGARAPRGTGPSAERREKSRFSVDFLAETDGRRIHTRVSGGDPGYTETSKMLAESALCLLLDDVPDVSGQVTTAVAMGPLLRERLVAQGMRFEVVED